MKSPEEQHAINEARRQSARRQVFENLRSELAVARGRIERAQRAGARGDARLAASLTGLRAEEARVLADLTRYAAAHGFALEAGREHVDV